MKKIVYCLIILAMFLSGCGTLEVSLDVPPASAAAIPAAPATLTPGFAPVLLSLDSTSEEIQSAMLESATKWETIWMDGTVTWYDPTGSGNPPQVFHEQTWIDQSTSHFRVLLGPGDGPAETFKVCDGSTILEMDLKTGQSQSHPLPEFAKAPGYVPPVEPGVAYPNPIWGQIGTPLSELVFSADRAQNQGTFEPVGMESITGRQTLVIQWTYTQNQLPSFKAWLDTETAVIFRIQEFGKGGGDEVQSDRMVSQVVYDAPLSDDLFGLQFSTLPSFSDISGNPLAPAEPAPTFSSEKDPLGQVYFFVSDHEYGNETVKLVRLPGSCVTGQNPCPEPETITPPFGLHFSLTSLVWSPDGNYAALAYPVSKDGNTANLFLFDPEQESWQPLAEFNFIDPPLWSADSNWLAFRVQDGQGGEAVYVVRRDGSDLTNMTDTEKLPQEGRPYILSGWINDNLILRSGNPRGGGLVYLRRISDGFTKPLFDTPWDKSDMVPFPDGSFLAYPDRSGGKTMLKLITPDGNTFRELATFQGGSIYPIVWSPDGLSIAFSVMDSDPSTGQDIYIIGRDGKGLQQVYRSDFGGINALSFSPDGKYLLFPDMDATGQHIYTVDPSTLETNLLQAPGLPLDWWWLAPSWRP
jgi:WD40 repeat protein